MAWRMVGPRGERRLIKGAVRAQEASRPVGRMAASTRGMNTGGLNNRGPQQPMTARGRGSVVTRSRRGMNLTTRGRGMLGRNPVTVSMEEDSEETYLDALSGGIRERLCSNKRTREPENGEIESSQPPQKH